MVIKHASLFTGIGGFDLAAEAMGWTNIFHCECNPFCKKILKYYWPDAISYGNIYETDFTIHRANIDILTGGFPCQPFSLAGERKGTDDYRFLWPEMYRSIREIKPPWVVAENVPGLLTIENGVVFERVCIDLENEGYEVSPFIIPACATNAPHKRDRIWIVAYSDSFNGKLPEIKRFQQKEVLSSWVSSEGFASNSTSQRLEGGVNSTKKWEMEIELGRLYINNNKFEIFPTQSPICIGNDGLSRRLDSEALLNKRFPRQPYRAFNHWRKETLIAAGNAIVPQVAFEIFKAIEKSMIE